ncbi:MAG: SUMF1/EgtB/PvdO family nonheme iron enzyme [Treponema sp.]|jgi:formylglycine-generating enzyme required for sulfatase activity|nr:SUMF1/EgtB/PvdO family nonheme iron enzyme [Treponema sp.]
MKKFIVSAILVGIFLVLTTCASGGNSVVKTVPLDQAIQEAAKNIEENVPAGQKVALLNFSSPTEQFSEYVIDELSIQLANGKKVVVVDRRELDLIRQEERFQMSGEVSDESMQSIGKKLGAQVVVSGSLNSMGGAYRFRMRVLNVETAVVETGSTADLSVGETKIAFMLSGAKPAPIPKPAVAPRPAPAQTATPSPALVRVEGGTFQMGSNDGLDDESPVHTVTITGFYMGKYEVTQKEWTAIMGNNPSEFKGDNLPVENISWYDAIEYCNRLSEKEKLTPAYTINKSEKDWRNNNEWDDIKWTVLWNRNANGFRLPTEAEWEYAARGGNGSPGNYTYAGSNNVGDVAWYGDNSAGSTQEVGAKKPNGLGVYDMSGNVWEWCWDWYGDYTSGAQTDPIGASSGSFRVHRGGSWSIPARFARSALRRNGSPDARNFVLGFRIVRSAL